MQVAKHTMLVFGLGDCGLGFLGWNGSEAELFRDLKQRGVRKVVG